jgi:hypothetical protein
LEREVFCATHPTAAAATGQKNDPKAGELLTSGSTNVINEDFPPVVEGRAGHLLTCLSPKLKMCLK